MNTSHSSIHEQLLSSVSSPTILCRLEQPGIKPPTIQLLSAPDLPSEPQPLGLFHVVVRCRHPKLLTCRHNINLYLEKWGQHILNRRRGQGRGLARGIQARGRKHQRVGTELWRRWPGGWFMSSRWHHADSRVLQHRFPGEEMAAWCIMASWQSQGDALMRNLESWHVCHLPEHPWPHSSSHGSTAPWWPQGSLLMNPVRSIPNTHPPNTKPSPYFSLCNQGTKILSVILRNTRHVLIFLCHHVRFGFRVILTEWQAGPQRAEEQDKELKTCLNHGGTILTF